MSLKALQQQIVDVVSGGIGENTSTEGLASGIPQLDKMLTASGIPRGRLTELLGTQGAGRTTVLRRIVQTTIDQGLWVACIDASRTLAPAHWAHMSGNNTLWVVRPPAALAPASASVPSAPANTNRGAWCADILLRSGAFALVVLDGAPVLTRSMAVRLSHLARDGNSAFIVTDDVRSGSMLGGALRLRVQLAPSSAAGKRASQRRIAVVMEKGGSPAKVEVNCVIGMESRLCTYPEVPDRRGVARRKRGKFSSPPLG